ncbi:hypothetical protein LPJ61_005280 [Coemansia biformis]|uniref:WW domain-containing protein n=1 Tax=Coemansia biformis TaxID=1286918 RepID=A0A9W7Y9E9_9FUNG|nr:hypothetical protein LPJ61_005280 [Coemansia biformis]
MSGSLPQNFIVRRDQRTGRDYFVNTATNQSQWEDPRIAAGGRAAPQGYGGPQASQMQQQGGYYQQGSPAGYYQQQPPPGYYQQGAPGGYHQQGPSPGGYYQQGPPPGAYYQQPPPGAYYQQPPPGAYYQQQPQQQPQTVYMQAEPKQKKGGILQNKGALLGGLALGGLAVAGVEGFMHHEREERMEAYDAGLADGYGDGFMDGADY